jgi:hypothetical protein
MDGTHEKHENSVQNFNQEACKEYTWEKRRIMEKQFLKEFGVRVRAGKSWLEYRPIFGSCQHGDEPSGFIKGGKIDFLSSF